MNRRIILLTALVAALLFTGTARLAAQGSAQYNIPWDAVTSGSEQMGSTHYLIYGTAGQAAVESSAGGDYQLAVGFWYGTSTHYAIYLPIVLK